MIKPTPLIRKGLKLHSKAIYDPMQSTYDERKSHYWNSDNGIVDFVEQVLGAKPRPYQIRILRAVQKYRRVSVKSLRGVGKTTTASWVLLWVMTCAPGETKCITTASVWEQLKSYLWVEIRKWALQADWDYLGVTMRDGRELLNMGISLDRGQRMAFATSPGKPERIEGAHAETLLYIIDEAKIVPDEIFDAIEGAFSTQGTNAFVLTISTPGAPFGRFYDIHQQKPGLEIWHTENVGFEEALACNAIDYDHAMAMKLLWGEDSPLFKNHFLGMFSDSSEYGIIKLSWLEASNRLWSQFRENNPLANMSKSEIDEITTYGIDPADTGMDMTAIARFVGRYCNLLTYDNKEVMETIPMVQKLTTPKERIPIGIDGNGVGAGAYQQLRKMGYRISNLIGGKATDKLGNPFKDTTGQLTFARLNIAMIWALREALDPNSSGYAEIALPPDDRLTQDLIVPEWKESSTGQIEFTEPRDKTKEKLGNRSPDGGDAVVRAWWLQSKKTRKRGAKVWNI